MDATKLTALKVGGEDFIGESPKLKGQGKLKYKLWVNSENELYVQLEDNEKQGTLSDIAFPVSSYIDKYLTDSALDTSKGINPHSGEVAYRDNDNAPGFLKAVLQRLLTNSTQ